MIKSKLGLYVISCGDVPLEWFEIAQPRLVVSMDPNKEYWERVKAAVPGIFILGREYRDDDRFQIRRMRRAWGRQRAFIRTPLQVHGAARRADMLRGNPIDRAGEWFAAIAPDAERMRGVYDAWMGPNEPAIWNDADADALVAFTARLADLLHERGHKYAAFSFSEGHPADLRLWRRIGKRAKHHADFVIVHEYDAPTMDRTKGWRCLRCLRPEVAGEIDVPIIVGECGIDGGVGGIDRPQTGWVMYGAEAEYLASLEWYDRSIQSVPQVLGAAIFAARWNMGGGSFDVAGCGSIRYYIGQEGVQPNAPTPAPIPVVPPAPAVPGIQPNAPTSFAIALIKSFEHFSAAPYLEPNGTWSIGFGHNGVDRNSPIITREYACSLLASDVQRAADAVRQVVRAPMTTEQFTALVDFTYNLGAGALRSSDLLEKLNAGDYAGAADEFLRWDKAGRPLVVLPGSLLGELWSGSYFWHEERIKMAKRKAYENSVNTNCPWVTVERTALPGWMVQRVGYRCSQPNDEPNDGNDMSCNIYVTVTDHDGRPAHGMTVHQNTPDDENDATKQTNDMGKCDFFMSGDSSFSPARFEHGPYRIYVNGSSDVVLGLGLPLKQHVNYDIEFRWQDAGSGPVDPPAPVSAARTWTREEIWDLAIEAVREKLGS